LPKSRVKIGRHARPGSRFSSVRWTSYAIAAGATALAATPAAEAEIHYSGLVNFKFDKHRPGSETHTFPLSQGVILGGFRYVRGFADNTADVFISGAAVSSGFRSVPSYASSIAASLLRGEPVSAGPFNHFGLGRLQDYACEFPGFQEPGTYATGFRFNNGAGIQYGWVRIKWGGCSRNSFIIQDYAWGDPGDRIKVGQTKLDENDPQAAPPAAKSSDAALVETSAKAHAPLQPAEASLGLLALGAVGVLACRKRQRAK
jgi:hypothetical protein